MALSPFRTEKLNKTTGYEAIKMPNFLLSAMKYLPACKRPLAAFYDRPLIWLMPFYFLGIKLSWTVKGGSGNLALACAAIFAALFTILSLKRKGPLLLAFSSAILAAAVVLLGFGLTAARLEMPSQTSHLINYVQDENAEPLIIGGYVKEGSSGRPGTNYRLILDARELIWPGDDGPLRQEKVTGLARISIGGTLAVSPGDYVRMPLTPYRLSGFKNPGSHTYKLYWGAQGVWVGAYVKSPWLVTSWPRKDKPGFFSDLRTEAVRFIESRVPQPAAGLLSAQLAGRRNAVDQNSEEVFRALGLSHILSVSGLHLGVWYGLCFWFLRFTLRRIPCFLRSRFKVNAVASAMALVPAIFYAGLAGTASPVVRSAIMIAAVALSTLALRRSDPWNILAAAAWLILLFEPDRLFTASFQLSFVATAGMLAVFTARPGAGINPPKISKSLWMQPVSWSLLHRIWLTVKRGKAKDYEEKPLPAESKRDSFFLNATRASLAGTFGTAPLVAWHFGRLPLAGLAANIVFTAVLSFLVLVPGLLALAMLPLSHKLAAPLMDFSGTIMMGLMPLLEALADMAGAGLLLPAPNVWFIIFYYAAGWFWLRSPAPWKPRLTASLVLLALAFIPGLINGQGDKNVLRFTVLDIGTGTSVHVNFPDKSQMLIDGGGSRNFDPGEAVITPYLLRQGLGRLNIVALSHPDQDHLKGLVAISRFFKPEEIWSSPWPENHSVLYQNFLDASKDSLFLDPGLMSRRNFGKAVVSGLWPEAGLKPPEKDAGKWVNNHSQVMRIDYAGISFLLTGDIEKETEKILVEKFGKSLEATVLVCPHHGSRNSLTPEFLEAVNPKWVVFTSARRNFYGLPHPETVKRAEDYGASTWRTDTMGAAVFEVREKAEGQLTVKAPL